jgi:hypothetical protein
MVPGAITHVGVIAAPSGFCHLQLAMIVLAQPKTHPESIFGVGGNLGSKPSVSEEQKFKTEGSN